MDKQPKGLCTDPTEEITIRIPCALAERRVAIAMSVAWVIFSILLMVDIQIGDRLYFNGAAYDLTTRVSVVDAITRTGVPPANPGYYLGHSQPLTFLYYFWYILGSMVDQLGGSYVSAYQAMIASITWCGLILVATLAVYLRLRRNEAPPRPWQKSILAAQFVAIGGLDFIILAVIMVEYKLMCGVLPFEGRIEGWNMPIMSPSSGRSCRVHSREAQPERPRRQAGAPLRPSWSNERKPYRGLSAWKLSTLLVPRAA